MKQAFTLIELLVVVLIIGILSAIALPQYQKSVWKARYTQAKVIAKNIADAEEIYYMSNGKYTQYFSELGVDIPGLSSSPWCNDKYCETSFSAGGITLVASGDVLVNIRKSGSNFLGYNKGFIHSARFPNQTRCIAYGDNAKPTNSDINWQICANETDNGSHGSWGRASEYWLYP